VSKHQPGLYKTHIGELVKGVADEKHPKVVEVALQALAAVVRLDEKVVPGDKCVFFSLLPNVNAERRWLGERWSGSSILC
jgi:hypothetical protein